MKFEKFAEIVEESQKPFRVGPDIKLFKKFIFTNNNKDLKKWNKKKIQSNQVKRKISNFGL
jgi:hypothetical protein